MKPVRGPFQTETAFFVVSGTLGFAVLAALASVYVGSDFSQGLILVNSLLETWISPIPQGASIAVLFSGTFLLLAVFAFLADEIGDSALPVISRGFWFFGEKRASWSVIFEDTEWRDVRRKYRVLCRKEEQAAWDEAKRHFGRYEYRYARTLAVFFVCLVLVGLFAGIVRGDWDAGLWWLGIGVLGTILFTWVWAGRQDKFVENLVNKFYVEHQKAHNSPPVLPTNYPFPFTE